MSQAQAEVGDELTRGAAARAIRAAVAVFAVSLTVALPASSQCAASPEAASAPQG